MRERIVLLVGVHHFRYRLVGDKLRRRERHRHAEGCRIGDVEGVGALGAVDCPSALHEGLVYGAVDLHALLDYCFVSPYPTVE